MTLEGSKGTPKDHTTRMTSCGPLSKVPRFNQNTINKKFFPKETKWVFIDEEGETFSYDTVKGFLVNNG